MFNSGLRYATEGDCLSAAHLRCEGKLSWETSTSSAEVRARRGPGIAILASRESELESCLTFRFPWNLPFLRLSGTSCCPLVLVLGMLLVVDETIGLGCGSCDLCCIVCLWFVSRVGCQGEVRNVIWKTSGRPKKMFKGKKNQPTSVIESLISQQWSMIGAEFLSFLHWISVHYF